MILLYYICINGLDLFQTSLQLKEKTKEERRWFWIVLPSGL